MNSTHDYMYSFEFIFHSYIDLAPSLRGAAHRFQLRLVRASLQSDLQTKEEESKDLDQACVITREITWS